MNTAINSTSSRSKNSGGLSSRKKNKVKDVILTIGGNEKDEQYRQPLINKGNVRDIKSLFDIFIEWRRRLTTGMNIHL